MPFLTVAVEQQLIHSIQRERGITCGWVTSGSANFRSLLQEHREKVDDQQPNPNIAKILAAIRARADAMDREEISDSTRAEEFYAVFTAFNSLVAHLLEQLAKCFETGTNNAYIAFAQLKELTGIEKAFLNGLLGLPLESLTAIPSRAFAELVIGLQQQKVHEAKVRDLAPAKLRDLLRAGFEYSPELKELQASLLEDFDIAKVRKLITAERCWALMTEHVDKLEQLQHLLFNEIKLPAHKVEAASASLQQVLRVAYDGSATEAKVALEDIRKMRPEHLKAGLMRILSTKLEDSNSQPRRTRQKLGVRGCKDEPEDDVRQVDESLRVPLDKLCFKRRIGSGSAGTTYCATWEGTFVAVKVTLGVEFDSWRTEVRTLSQLRHPNIIQLLGVLVEPPTYGLVLELCEGLDLGIALQGPTAPGFALRVAIGVAAGMLYLHGQGVMHRDLKSSNVLLDHGDSVKLTDFGLATMAPDSSTSAREMTAETGTLRWMAPEVIRHEPYSRRADVFSYGMVLYELITHQIPFVDRPPLQAAVAIALNEEMPPLPDGVPQSMRWLITACWASEPKERPNFKQVLAALYSFEKSLSRAEIDWLDAPDGHPVLTPMPSHHRQQQQLSQKGVHEPEKIAHELEKGVHAPHAIMSLTATVTEGVAETGKASA